jgi:hypothetical protein
MIFLLILLAGLTGGLADRQIQIPDALKTTTAQKDIWNLPHNPKARNPSTAYKKLRKLKLWNTDKQGGSSTKSRKRKKSKWKFVGIIKKGNQRYVLLLENKKITQYALKSDLPSGDHILKIHDDSIEVAQDGNVEVIHLYQ